jgi:ribosomal protein S18 acetylase RimI-like enzyme
MEIVIRAAVEGDYEALSGLYRQADRLHAEHLPDVFKVPGEHPRSRDVLLGAIASETAALLVAEHAGEVVGFVRLMERGTPDVPFFVARRYAQIEEIVVAEAFRRRGVGRLLMEQAHQWARGRGLQSVELTVWEFNEGAIALYESLGYGTLMRRMTCAVGLEGAS